MASGNNGILWHHIISSGHMQSMIVVSSAARETNSDAVCSILGIYKFRVSNTGSTVSQN